MRWGSEALLRETSGQAGVYGRREGSKIKLASFEDGEFCLKVFAYTGERGNFLRDTAGGRLQTSKTKKLTRLLKVQ